MDASKAAESISAHITIRWLLFSTSEPVVLVAVKLQRAEVRGEGVEPVGP